MADLSMNAEIEWFDMITREAERRRATLKTKFGLTDNQIGNLVLARQQAAGEVDNLALAFLRAKQNLAGRQK